MKKYITIAALLAAGSAFANAADTYTWTGAANNADWGTALNWSVNGQAAPTAPSGDDNKATDDNRTKVVIGDDAGTITSNEGKTVLSSLIVDIGSGSTLVVDYVDAKIVNSIFNISGELSFSNSMWVDMPNNDSKVNNHSRTTSQYNLLADGVVNYTGSVNNINTAALAFNYDFDTESQELKVNTKTLITSSQTALTDILRSGSFTINGNAAPTVTATVVGVDVNNLTVDDIGKYWLSCENEGNSVVLNYVSGTSLVPEPSAFGLLAGIGALALVASRRRRK